MFPPPPSVDLGLPPWTDDALERAVFLDSGAVQRALASHPGREIHDRLESLASVLRLFQKTAEELLVTIGRFHTEAHENYLLHRSRRNDLQHIEEEIQENLYVFAAYAMTLVDQSRTLSEKVHVPGYCDRVTTGFSESPRHRFIQELRVDMIHVTLHEPSWQVTWGRDKERTTSFLLQASQLTRLEAYHSLAKKYVDEHPNGIDVGRMVSEYTAEVCELHTWFREAVEAEAQPILLDFRRSQRTVRAVSSRCWWRLILLQVVIQGKRDPYAYLDQYLTPEELREVLSLPHRSKAQVDRIVELVDGDGACNDELREIVYRAFNAERP